VLIDSLLRKITHDDEIEEEVVSDEDYVEPHIDVPGIPYMAVDAVGGSHMEECHRARARTARKRLEDFFWPVIEKNQIGFALDDTCPLARGLDMLKPFESIKKLRRRGEWQVSSPHLILTSSSPHSPHLILTSSCHSVPTATRSSAARTSSTSITRASTWIS
jgi:hypothetical protein